MLTVQKQLLQYCQLLQETPTAPFCEQWMCSTLDQILGEIPGLQIQADRFGNRLAVLGSEYLEAEQTPIVYVAHLDHPGFVCEEGIRGKRELEVHFEGRVFNEYFLGSRVRLFRSALDVGVGATIRECSERRELENNRIVLLECDEPVTDPVLGMWDLVPHEVENGVLSSRVCDDLCGVASIIWALAEIAKLPKANRPRRAIAGLFSRAEEAGFCGSLAATTDPETRNMLPQNALFVSVEISKTFALAPLGGGSIIRLGDKAGLFDSAGYAQLAGAFEVPSAMLYQQPRRLLMDGGTCEATAFSALGLRAGGLCAPVGNYHNMGLKEERAQISPEQVSVSDLCDLARMIQLSALHQETASKSEVPLMERLTKFAETGKKRLSPVPLEFTQLTKTF